MPNVKNKERYLKVASEKKLVANRGFPIRLLSDFSRESLQARRDWQEIFSHEKQGPTAKIALPSEDIL